jgi:hypothetical protein
LFGLYGPLAIGRVAHDSITVRPNASCLSRSCTALQAAPSSASDLLSILFGRCAVAGAKDARVVVTGIEEEPTIDYSRPAGCKQGEH